MKAYFDRTAPFYLLAEPCFESVEVDVPQAALDMATNIGTIKTAMTELFENSPTYEECGQASADALVALFDQLAGEYTNGTDYIASGLEASAGSAPEGTALREGVLSEDV